MNNFVWTFKGQNFGRQGFLYCSYRAFGARKLCTFRGDILSSVDLPLVAIHYV